MLSFFRIFLVAMPLKDMPIDCFFSTRCHQPDYLPKDFICTSRRILLLHGIFSIKVDNLCRLEARSTGSKPNPLQHHLANSNSAINVACLKALGDTHLKLHAFTLAEYCYVKSKTENTDLVRCLVEQRNPKKCKEALRLTGVMHSTVDDDTKAELIELEAKYVSVYRISTRFIRFEFE